MEQKPEYKRLEIEVIDYEYEDVITTSNITPIVYQTAYRAG